MSKTTSCCWWFCLQESAKSMLECELKSPTSSRQDGLSPPGPVQSQQRGAEGCGCWAAWGEVPVLLGFLVVCGIGTAVYVAIGFQAVLGCSHHVRGFHCGSENTQDDTQIKTKACRKKFATGKMHLTTQIDLKRAVPTPLYCNIQ